MHRILALATLLAIPAPLWANDLVKEKRVLAAALKKASGEDLAAAARRVSVSDDHVGACGLLVKTLVSVEQLVEKVAKKRDDQGKRAFAFYKKNYQDNGKWKSKSVAKKYADMKSEGERGVVRRDQKRPDIQLQPRGAALEPVPAGEDMLREDIRLGEATGFPAVLAVAEAVVPEHPLGLDLVGRRQPVPACCHVSREFPRTGGRGGGRGGGECDKRGAETFVKDRHLNPLELCGCIASREPQGAAV